MLKSSRKKAGRAPVVAYAVQGHVLLECGPAQIAITPAIGGNILARLPQVIREADMLRGQVHITSKDGQTTISMSAAGARILQGELPGLLALCLTIGPADTFSRRVYFPIIPEANRVN